MNCTKCNSNIPDGAKFCPSCGASVAAFAPQQMVCEKCGLELGANMRFCTVCGGAGVARAAAPETANSTANAAVDLNKPSQSDGLVSAMNNAANAIPMPSNGVPTPSNGVPTPSNNIPTPANSGFGSSAQTAPAFVADSAPMTASSAPVMTPVSNGAAAAAVKKGNGGKIVLFSILGVILVAVAAVAVMFFTNRAAFLSTLMGKEKYATMVEGTSIKNATDKLDIPSITNGIKSASGTYQILSSNYGMSPLAGLSYSSSAKTKPMMSYASSALEADLKKYSEELSKALLENYGANCVSETVSFDIQLTDATKKLIKDEMGSDDYELFLELIDVLQGSSFNATVSAKDSTSAITMSTKGTIAVDAKVVMDGQDMYISLPFASDKVFKITVNAPSESYYEEFKPLELDEKEVERLITECVEIYLDHYKKSSIEMDNGSIKAAGVTVEGKLITAEFKGESLYQLFYDITEHIVSDDYFAAQMVDYINSFDNDITKKEFKDEILDMFDPDDFEKDDKLIIKTVIDRNGNVLGKTITAVSFGDTAFEISYADSDKEFGAEVDVPDEDFNITVSGEKQDKETTKCVVKIKTYDDEEYGFNVVFKDNGTKTFCGKDIPCGELTVRMLLPESFSDQLGAEAFAAINGASLSFNVNVQDENTIEYTVNLSVQNYGSFHADSKITVSNDDSALTVPANAIDITGAVNGDFDENTMTVLSEFGKEVVEAFVKVLPEDLSSSIGLSDFDDLFGGFSPSYGGAKADRDDIDYLIDFIREDIDTINEMLKTGDTGYMTSRELESLLSDYQNLYLRIITKNYDMTEDEYYDFYDEYDELWDQLPSYNGNTSGNNDFNTGVPKIDAMGGIINSAYADAAMISMLVENGTIELNTAAEKAMYQDIEDAFTAIYNYSSEVIEDGDISKCTDAQIDEWIRLFNIAKVKVDVFKANFDLSAYQNMWNY